MSYTLPQVQVYQEVTQVPTAVVQNLNPFYYGANYSLRRYSEASEKALIGIGAYDPDAGNTSEYPAIIGGSAVDTSYVKVYAEDVWLKYATIANSATNPLYCVSETSRNKLRAAPRIVDGGSSIGEVGGVAEPAVTLAAKGYHTGTVSLPEAYYFTPSEAFTLGTDVGEMLSVTTEGVEDSFEIPVNVMATNIQSVDGLVLDFGGATGDVHPPRIVKFANAGGTQYFTATPKTAKIPELVNSAIDSSDPSLINITLGAGVNTVTYADKKLTIVATAAQTLTALKAAIYAAAGDDLELGDMVGTGSGAVSTSVDQDANNLDGAGDVDMIPFAFRTMVYENSWVFKTANGVSRSGVLYKDVEIGDKVYWTVTPASTGVEVSGWTTVAGFEADYTRPLVEDATEGDDNQDTLAAVNISAGVAAGVPDTDNVKSPDFAATDISVDALSATINYFIGSHYAGVLTDNVVITITTAGAAGTARARVESESGAYARSNVLIESGGGTAGQIYVGGNVFVKFNTPGGGDANFVAGDVYTVGPSAADESPTLVSGFTKVTDEFSGGSYTGTVDNTYTVEVTRGGLFVRNVTVIPGLTVAGGTTLSASISGWTAGDVDDEYVLECTSGGSLATAQFSLVSNRGDSASGLVFAAAAAEIPAGSSGMTLSFSTDVTFVAKQYWVVVVRASRPKVRITDAAGIDQESAVTVEHDDEITVGLNGATITFPTNLNTLGLSGTYGGLLLGDKFEIAVTASAAGAVQTLVLADELPEDVACGQNSDGTYTYEPDRFAAEISLVKASKQVPRENENPLVVPGNWNWTAGSSEIEIEADVALQDSAWVDPLGEMPFLPMVHGDLYVEYRSLLQEYTDAIYSIADITQCETELGPAVADNPLSLAVYCGLENIGRGTVYFTAIPTDDAAGDATALAKAGLVSNIWALNPAGVTDPARHSLLEAHINSMSTEIKKRWRGGFVGRELPSTEEILTSATNPSHVDWKATVDGTGNKRVTLTQDGSLLTDLSVGDEVRLQFAVDAWGRTTYTTDTVASISSNTVFYLTSGLPVAVPVANKIEAYHHRSSTETAAAVKAISENYGNKRMYHVFPPNLGKYGTYVNAAYGAASIAGMVGSVVPQQGLTNIEVNGYDDVPYSYGMFSYDELNTIAEGGTLIIMQDIKAGSVYVRHQISTAYKDGNLNTMELSMVKNLDSISYYFADLLKPFIGRYNVTPQLVSVIRTQVQDGLNYLGSLTSVGLLGPQIILANGNTKIRTVEQHPTLKDRILATVDIELPAPLNVIEFHIVV